ncbi:MAG: hypothetical protein Q7T55_24850 [Solirubrobacteraceae bacterium]|nr:hypothetical protein [Solirubrobacteraceae bacterium]
MMLRYAQERLKAVSKERLVDDDRGTTLVEVMVGLLAGMVVLMLAYGMWDAATKSQANTADRIDANARGRVAMERITRDIRSQQCLDSATPAMIWAADLGMEFYSSVADENLKGQRLERRRLEWVKDPVQFKDGGGDVGDIVETVWWTNQTAAPFTFNVLKRKVVLAEDVQRAVDKAGLPIAIFQYYGYDPSNVQVGRPSATPYPLVTSTANAVNTLGRGVSTANISKVVIVDINYLSRPRRAKNSRKKVYPVQFFNRVSVRTADPSDPTRSPLCI